jgi:PAS domain S-box-containing protein
MDQDLRYTYWNKASEALTGISAKDALGKSLLEIFPDTSWVRSAEKMYRDVLRNQEPQTFVNNAELDGSHYVFEINAYPSRSGVSVFVKDITERRKIEDALRESEKRYSRLYHGINEAVALYELPDLRITNCNNRYEDLHKLISGKDVKDATLFDVAPMVEAEDWERIREEVGKVLAGERLPDIGTYEVKIRDLEGKGRVVEAKPSFYEEKGQVAGIQVALADITERKRMEETLRDSEEKLRKMFESTTEAISVIDLKGIVMEVNQGTVDMHGFSSKGELLGKSAFELIAPCDRERIAANMKKAVKQEAIRGVEYTMLRADGSEFAGELSTSVLRDASDNLVGHISIARDITERKEGRGSARAGGTRNGGRPLMPSATPSPFTARITGFSGRTRHSLICLTLSPMKSSVSTAMRYTGGQGP